MTTSAVSQMHRDHRAWRSESALWHDQLREWQQQTQQALVDLEAVRAMFHEHERRLETNAAAVRLYDQDCADHEHQMVQSESDSAPVHDESDHKTEAWDHTHQRERHEACKLQHHSLMARWKMLLDSLDLDQ
jgi:hypothetical protein